MTTKPVTIDDSTDEARFFVTIHHDDERPSVNLLVPRSAAEVEQLRAKGHRLTTNPAPSNVRRPNHFSEALTACSKLYSHCIKTGNDRLAACASEAVAALLKNSGARLDDDAAVHSGVSRARPMAHTIPGIGVRR